MFTRGREDAHAAVGGVHGEEPVLEDGYVARSKGLPFDRNLANEVAGPRVPHGDQIVPWVADVQAGVVCGDRCGVIEPEQLGLNGCAAAAVIAAWERDKAIVKTGHDLGRIAVGRDAGGSALNLDFPRFLALKGFYP